MRAFFNGRSENHSEPLGETRDLWRRTEGQPGEAVERRGASVDRRRWIERVASRVGFESFERVFFGLVGVVVLAGSVIVFGAALTRPKDNVEATATTGVLVAKQEHHEASQQPAREPAKAEIVKTVQARPPAAEPVQPTPSLGQAPSMLSQIPLRESAREALALAAKSPESKSPAPPRDEKPAEALGYAADPQPVAETESESSEKAARSAAAAPDEKLQAVEKLTRCFVKVSGRVLTSGNCRVSHKGQSVTLAYGGSTVSISPQRGREWALTLGGRNVGKVYRSGGCWGSNNHTWICEKGV